MRKLRLLTVLLFAFHFTACSNSDTDASGDNVTEQFLSEYSGSYEEQDGSLTSAGERMIIERDGQIEVLQHRRVGERNNPAIPAGTACSFVLNGQIISVVQLNNEARERSGEEGTYKLPQTHNLAFSVHQLTLTDELRPGSTTDRGCINFQEKMNQQFPIYTYGMELFGAGTIRFHTRDEGDYQGGERTESTLDEVFIRD